MSNIGRNSRKLKKVEKTRPKRVAMYVDFPNYWAGVISKGRNLDLSILKHIANLHGDLVSSKVYLTVRSNEKVKPKILNFEREGFRVVSRFVPETEYGAKKDIDTYLVTDFICDALTLDLDIQIIVSDDSDFAPAMVKSMETGVNVISIVSNIENAQIIGYSASDYYDLSKIESIEDELRKEDEDGNFSLETFSEENIKL